MQFAFFGRVLIVVVLVLSAGCANESPSAGAKGQSAEQLVTIRAQARWDALRAAQYDKAYAFISPTTRQTLPAEVYRGRISGASWLGAQVVKVVCEPEICDVSIKLEYYVLPNLKDTQVVEEKWISDSGNWWFVYRG